jgi:hypothetical protein
MRLTVAMIGATYATVAANTNETKYVGESA